jgi:hypothetical protein
LNGRNIPFVNNVKYLGVIFHKRITWRLHIEMIEAKADRGSRFRFPRDPCKCKSGPGLEPWKLNVTGHRVYYFYLLLTRDRSMESLWAISVSSCIEVHISFEIFTAVTVHILVFLVVAPCNLVGGYRFGRTETITEHTHFYAEERGFVFLRNGGIRFLDFTVWQLRKPYPNYLYRILQAISAGRNCWGTTAPMEL